MNPPEASECAPFYQKYIEELPDGEILDILKNQKCELLALLKTLPEEKSLYRYAKGKWSIKEIIGHLNDVERVFTYRAMCFARNDPGPFPGMDENDYVKHSTFDSRRLKSLLEEYSHLRAATVAFFESIDAEIGIRRGTASDCEFTVRALQYIIAGHEHHHLDVLKERYLQ